MSIIESLKKHNNDKYKKLLFYAKELHKTFENDCNGCIREKYSFESWKDYDIDRERQMIENEIKQKTFLRRIKTYCESLGLNFYIQSDPRGNTLYVSKMEELNQENYHNKGELIA